LGVEIEIRSRDHHLDRSYPRPTVVVACDGREIARCGRSNAISSMPTIAVGRKQISVVGRRTSSTRFHVPVRRHGIAGWVWSHAYGYDDHASTFVVECYPNMAGLGFDTLTVRPGLDLLQEIFAEQLGGRRPLAVGGVRRAFFSVASNFPDGQNERWNAGNTVLMAMPRIRSHFSSGPGTLLANARRHRNWRSSSSATGPEGCQFAA